MSKRVDKDRVRAQRLGVHSDDIVVLFFSFIFLTFLVCSSFRLFAIGKFLDDFIFLFLFGWTKYLAYLFLYAIVLPIFFRYFLEIRFSFFLGIFFTFCSISWLIQNLTIIAMANNDNNQDIWWEINFYDFDDFLSYMQLWWDSTIINNFDGFFGSPISFDDWTDFASFFPTFAAGGIISNFLVFLSGFGGFITSLIASIIALVICLSWLFFARPFLLLIFVFIFFLPIVRYFQKQKKVKLVEKEDNVYKTEWRWRKK